MDTEIKYISALEELVHLVADEIMPSKGLVHEARTEKARRMGTKVQHEVLKATELWMEKEFLAKMAKRRAGTI